MKCHTVYNLPGKITRQKLAPVPFVSVLKKIKNKKHLDSPYVCPKLQHFTANVYYIFVFNFSQIQDARNCSKQSVYVFCSKKFVLYKGACCCKQVVEEFSHLVCCKEILVYGRENAFSKRKTNNWVKWCLNLQFRANIRRISKFVFWFSLLGSLKFNYYVTTKNQEGKKRHYAKAAPYNGLYREAPPKRGAIFKLTVN